MSVRMSAGILFYRRSGGADLAGVAGEAGAAGDGGGEAGTADGPDGGGLEVLLAHPGGPHFANRDEGDWTIPKGEPDVDGEPLAAVARREFAEETGTEIDPGAPAIELGTIVQKGGKVVYAWAVEGDMDPAAAHSNTFQMEWPPRSGRWESFPEIDRVAWFGPDEARLRIKESQAPFIDRLEAALRG